MRTTRAKIASSLAAGILAAALVVPGVSLAQVQAPGAGAGAGAGGGAGVGVTAPGGGMTAPGSGITAPASGITSPAGSNMESPGGMGASTPMQNQGANQQGQDQQNGQNTGMPNTGQNVTVPNTSQNVTVPNTSQSPAMPNTSQSPAMPNTGQSPAMPNTGQSPVMPNTSQNMPAPDTSNLSSPSNGTSTSNASLSGAAGRSGSEPFSLTSPAMLGGVQFNAGDEVSIVSLPSGVSMPQNGEITLPAGSTISLPSRPDLGNIVTSGPLTANISPMTNQAATPDLSNMTMLSGNTQSAFSLNSPVTLNGVQLASGDQLQVVGLPSGINAGDLNGLTSLPTGTMVTIPSRPDLGTITLNSAVSASMAGQTAELGSLTLSSAMELNGVQIPSGQQIQIVGLPNGITLPENGSVTLPAGTSVIVTGRPDLGTIVTQNAISGDVVSVTGMPTVMELGQAPSLNAAPLLNAVPGSGGIVSVMLSNGATLGGVPFAVGQPIQIMGFPEGFVPPPSGMFVLPQGAMISIPGRPELGTFMTEGPLSTEVAGVQVPGNEIMGVPGQATIGEAAIQPAVAPAISEAPSPAISSIPAPAAPAVIAQPGAAQLQVRQIPSTGGTPLPFVLFSLAVVGVAGISLRLLGRQI